MSVPRVEDLGYLPAMPRQPQALGIGVVGAGFIVCHCHLVAYRNAGFRLAGITSRTLATAREVAGLRGVPNVFPTLEAMLDDPRIDVVDVAVPPLEQPGVIRRILGHPRRVKGILAQKPLAMTLTKRRGFVAARPRRACRSTRTCGTTSRSASR